MTGPRGYASPAAFRRALTDRLQGLAATGRWPLQHLQRQMAYDRLLERLYLADDGSSTRCWPAPPAAPGIRGPRGGCPERPASSGPVKGAIAGGAPAWPFARRPGPRL